MANPLDRTWYDTLLDDDGSGTTGTVWNRAAVDGLLDSVDASLAVVVDRTGAPAANQIALFNDPDTLTASANFAVDPSGGALLEGSTYAYVNLIDRSQPADGKVFRITASLGKLQLLALTDAGGLVSSVDLLRGGRLVLSAGQITFPATAIPSADATTLDDYREIVWMPYFSGSLGNVGTTYSSQLGRGIKVGRQVTLWAAMTVATPGTITGSLRLWGMPFMSANDIPSMGSVTIGAFSPTAATFASVSGYVAPGVTTADLTMMPPGGGSELVPLPGTAVAAGTTMYCEVRYLAAS